MIHPTAIISSKAIILDNVEIGPYSIIYENVIIGNNSKIGAYCEVGIDTPLAKEKKLFIGNNVGIYAINFYSAYLDLVLFQDNYQQIHIFD